MLKPHSQDYMLIGISLCILQKKAYILVLIFLSLIFYQQISLHWEFYTAPVLENTLVF